MDNGSSTTRKQVAVDVLYEGGGHVNGLRTSIPVRNMAYQRWRPGRIEEALRPSHGDFIIGGGATGALAITYQDLR